MNGTGYQQGNCVRCGNEIHDRRAGSKYCGKTCAKIATLPYVVSPEKEREYRAQFNELSGVEETIYQLEQDVKNATSRVLQGYTELTRALTEKAAKIATEKMLEAKIAEIKARADLVDFQTVTPIEV